MDDRSETGLIFARLLDGRGGGRALDWEGIQAWRPEQGLLWVHLDYAAPRALDWLEQRSGLDEVVRESLTAEDPRPRSLALHNGLLVVLRGINHNPGAEPEDMVSLRTWVEAGRAISLRHRRLQAPSEVCAELDGGSGPTDEGGLLVELCERLAERIGEAVMALDDDVDSLEDEVLTAESYALRKRIGGLRRDAIALRRYLAPQRDAMTHLQVERVAWLDELDRARLREVGDRVTRAIEDLDSARDRAAVTSEELNTRLSESMNRTMYLLSIVAAIFLPLGLLTGLLGINVGGIPGSDNPHAFLAVCALLVALALGLAAFFRLRRWI
jgi:zinc transporter